MLYLVLFFIFNRFRDGRQVCSEPGWRQVQCDVDAQLFGVSRGGKGIDWFAPFRFTFCSVEQRNSAGRLAHTTLRDLSDTIHDYTCRSSLTPFQQPNLRFFQLDAERVLSFSVLNRASFCQHLFCVCVCVCMCVCVQLLRNVKFDVLRL